MQQTITIGVTGHRDIVKSEKLKKEIENFFLPLCDQYQTINLFSPLADGADRFVAEIFLDLTQHYKGLKLIVPMPFNQKRYMEDFDKQSQQEFLNYLKVAEKVYEVHNSKGSNYKRLGMHVVDHSQILLALWDGTFNHKIGGTGDIVTYARNKEKSVVHFLCQRTT